MKIAYQLTERQKQEKGVFLTFRKIGTADKWWELLFGRKLKMEFVKVFYPISPGPTRDMDIHKITDMAYVPSGEMVPPHEYVIFSNLLNMKYVEDERPASVEKIYTREPFKCREGWVNPNKEREPTGA